MKFKTFSSGFLSILVVGLAITGSFLTSSAYAGINDGLIAHYKFDGITGPVVDSASSFDGTNNGATRGVSGKIGNAFLFDGTNDYVDTLPVGDIPTTTTISLWIHPTAITGPGNQILGSIANADGGKDGIILNHEANTDFNIRSTYSENNVGQGEVLTPVHSVPLDTWTHIAYSWDAINGVKLYTNGALAATGSYSAPPASHDRALMIGKSILSQSQSFTGRIDDVRIWNRALSGSEVASLVPEPSSFALLAMSVLLVVRRQFRREGHHH